MTSCAKSLRTQKSQCLCITLPICLIFIPLILATLLTVKNNLWDFDYLGEVSYQYERNVILSFSLVKENCQDGDYTVRFKAPYVFKDEGVGYYYQLTETGTAFCYKRAPERFQYWFVGSWIAEDKRTNKTDTCEFKCGSGSKEYCVEERIWKNNGEKCPIQEIKLAKPAVDQVYDEDHIQYGEDMIVVERYLEKDPIFDLEVQYAKPCIESYEYYLPERKDIDPRFQKDADTCHLEYTQMDTDTTWESTGIKFNEYDLLSQNQILETYQQNYPDYKADAHKEYEYTLWAKPIEEWSQECYDNYIGSYKIETISTQGEWMLQFMAIGVLAMSATVLFSLCCSIPCFSKETPEDSKRICFSVKNCFLFLLLVATIVAVFQVQFSLAMFQMTGTGDILKAQCAREGSYLDFNIKRVANLLNQAVLINWFALVSSLFIVILSCCNCCFLCKKVETSDDFQRQEDETTNNSQQQQQFQHKNQQFDQFGNPLLPQQPLLDAYGMPIQQQQQFDAYGMPIQQQNQGYFNPQINQGPQNQPTVSSGVQYDFGS